MDEDSDELDLIGSAALKRRREAQREASKVMRLAGLPGAQVEASMAVDNHALSTLEPSKKAGGHQDEVSMIEVVRQQPSRTIGAMVIEEQKDLPNSREPIRDKDDAIEAIIKPSDAGAAEHFSTVEDKMDVSTSSVTVVHDNVTSQHAQASLLPPTPASVASSMQTTPVGIQQTPVEIPQPDDKLPHILLSEPVAQSTEPTTHIDNYRFHPTYPIPPLSVLGADFTKKAKPIKRKKDKDKDKEREKERESKRDKEDNVPMGLSRWAATLMANPLWRKVSRANKTLSTHDWSVRILVLMYPLRMSLKFICQVAMTELRLIRTIERIDLLKNDGRWSFRQPKKQRGIGGSVKSHWDYLLDEMVGLHLSSHKYMLMSARNG
jgi:chromatin modification-related protein VID21